MSYTKNHSKPAVFRQLTGVSIEDFEHILPYFNDAHDDYFRYHQLGGKPRAGIRPARIYRNSPIPSKEERLYFILYYLKNNPTQSAMADRFDMDQANCSRWIHDLYGILKEALSEAGLTPASTQKDLLRLYELIDQKQLSILLHDGTEREVPRPSNTEEQKDKYSGKKKRHKVKNGVISTFLGAILFVSPTVSGRVHDKTIAEGYFFPKDSIVMQDTGYQGYLGDWDTVMPFKKPRGGELEQYQKDHNRFISSKRVRVEHHIGSCKILRIVKDECRARKAGFTDSLFKTAAAIHNLRYGVKLPLKL